MTTVIYTIGVYGFAEPSFRQAVAKANPEVFVDIRRKRGVRGSHQAFGNSVRLQALLTDLDIPYVHRLDLAPPFSAVQAQGETDRKAHIARRDRNTLSANLIATYQREVLADFDTADFMESLGAPSSLMLFCLEEKPEACHRSLLADRIAADLGGTVHHLLPPPDTEGIAS